MEEVFVRVWEDLVGRVGGPLTFRLVLQPIMAGALGLMAGVRDARSGRPPYLWTILTDKARRGALLREGWRSTARVFVVAAIVDGIYQWLVLRWIYPLEILIVAVFLAVVPCLLIRGPVNRLVRRWRRRRTVAGQPVQIPPTPSTHFHDR